MLKAFKIYSKAVWMLLGVFFLVVGLIFFFRYDPAAYDMETTATITSIDEYYEYVGGDNELHYDVYVTYRAEGKTYENVLYPAYNSSMEVGDELVLYYMSGDPTAIAGSDKESGPWVGLIAAIIGTALIAINIYSAISGKKFLF